MKVVALTGGIGSGKSEATHVFQSLGINVIDLDDIAHQLTNGPSEVNQLISQAFGEAYIDEHGALNREKMRALVFSDDQARTKLNNILHPAIYQKVESECLRLAKEPYVVIAVPLLVESQRYQSLADHIVLVDCDESKQLERVMQRNRMTEEQVLAIMRAQSSRQARKAIANTIIENNGNLSDLTKKITDFHENYINTCIVSQ